MDPSAVEARPMTSIKVYVLAPTEAGRLYPRYVNEGGILAVESTVARPWPFGVDIDGGVVFDLDEWRVLANFDLHMRRSLWKRERLEDEVATIATPGDLAFAPETVETKSFSIPLTVRMDPRTGRVSMRFGALKPDRAVELSPMCSALLREDNLLGFDIRDIAEE